MIISETSTGYRCLIPLSPQHNPLYVGLSVTSQRGQGFPDNRIVVQLTNAQADRLAAHLLKWAAINRDVIQRAAKD